MKELDLLNSIKKLMDIKKDLFKELEETQKNCPHRNGYDVKFIGSSNDVRQICKICKLPIGYPTKKELEDNGFI